MKTNAIYFLILTCLLTFTYFFQELKERERFAEKDRREILFNEKVYGPFLGFNLNGTNFFKDADGKFKTKKNIPISQEKVLKVLNILSGLRVEKILPMKEESFNKSKKLFFSTQEQQITFKFKNSEMIFTLGEKLTYSQSFYFKVKSGKKTVFGIAKDVSDFKALYQKENYENSSKRYDRLSNILKLNRGYFIDKKIMGPFSKVHSIKFEGIGGEKFSLDFSKHTTLPAHYEGLSYSKAKFNIFKKDLMELKGTSIVENWERKKLSKKLVTMIFSSMGKEDFKLELFGKYGKEKSFFILKPEDSLLYKVNQKSLLPFVVSVQDFWSLYPLRKTDLKKSNSALNEGMSRENLAKQNPEKKSEKAIISLLKRRPYKVSKKKPIKVGASFEFKRDQFSFKVFKTKEELVFFNDKTGVSYHYWINGKSLPQSKMERLILSQR